jgi:hypothetical protein
MNTSTALRGDAAVDRLTAAGTAKFLRPIVKPRKSLRRLAGEILSHGGPGFLQFAIKKVENQASFL